MKTKMFFLLFCAVAFFGFFSLINKAGAECLRCQGGSELACTGDSKPGFISKCGRPDDTAYINNTALLFYNCGDGQFIERVSVENGKVTSIEHGERGSGPVKCQ